MEGSGAGHDREVPTSIGAATPGAAGRIDAVRAAAERWKHQLVDLGGRNNLLFYKERATSTLDLSATAGADEATVGRLLAGSRVRLSEIYGIDQERLPTMARRARAACKKAQENLEERGLSTLHCGWGLATWQSERSSSEPLAPVLLSHVALIPRGGAAEDFDVELDGEWELSPTLIQVLSTDFGVNIDAQDFEGSLDAATAGDKTAVFERLTKLAADVPGFSITSGVVLANFSYANLAMVVDLDHGLEIMAGSDLIAAIIGDEHARAALRARQSATEVPDPDHLPPADEFLVLDADASQSYVVDATVAGANLVVEGPPGTGKSQTIANLIASLSARGKRTLFVAEKRAAIDAVLKRLDQTSLADLVLDLHDTTLTRAKVIADLDRALHGAATTPLIDHSAQHAELARRRRELVERTGSMSKVHEPWGISAIDIFTELPGFDASVQSTARLSATSLARMDQTLRIELEGDLERVVLLGGLPVVHGASPWSAAFRAGTITTSEGVAQLLTALRHLRADDLPAVGRRLEAMLASCGLRRPATLGDWAGVFGLLDGVATVLRVFQPAIFEQDLDRVLADLAPAQRGSVGRIGAAFNSRYRSTRKEVGRLLRGAEPSPRQLYEAVAAARDQVQRWRKVATDGRPPRLPEDLAGSRSDHERLVAELRAVAATSAVPELDAQAPSAVIAQLDGMLARAEDLEQLPEIHRLYSKLADAGLGSTVDDVAARGLDAGGARECVRFVWYSSVLEQLKALDPQIARFQGDVHRTVVERFCEADTAHIEGTPQRIHRLVAERVTEARDRFPHEAEVLAHQARLKRRHKTIRQLRVTAPNVLGALKPCWAMSPLLVAQLLPAEPCFDVVVFDEASQVTPAGAIGALLRAPQVVVAGDRKQLPPTSFFISSSGDGDEDDPDGEGPEDYTENIESILDVMGSLLPPPNGTRTLEWHYRSRDERLIAFSNAQTTLYDHSLTTFPGTSVDGAVDHVLVPHVHGHTDTTASSSAEVERVAALVADHARKRPDESLGVIAFGIAHANRIDEALRLARKSDAALDAYMSGRPSDEAIFVKNLERVQGDERDAIILSVGYCKTADGRMHYGFGPINREGGYRRLNVAVTRARQRMTVVSSFGSADMDPAKLRSEGPQMLQRLLEYAESGGTQLGTHTRPHTTLNPFERDVTVHLSAAGIPLVAQYGASGYWIDFAAKHPTRPGQMVLAIEADGASYHSQPSARNRDRLRQEHLQRLGWRFHRIWSQEWFLHREREVARALAVYRSAVDAVDHPQSLGPGALATTDAPARSETEDGRARDDASPQAADETPRRAGHFPARRHLPIGEYSLPELVAAVRWVESDTLLRTNDELLEEVLHQLGFQRRGKRIAEAIELAIAAAHRV